MRIERKVDTGLPPFLDRRACPGYTDRRRAREYPGREDWLSGR